MKQRIALLLVIPVVLSFSFFQSDSLPESVKRGKLVYEGNCISCHMANGEGLEGAFPPLAKTGRLTDKKRLVKIIYNGLEGPITVNGKEYNNQMNPLALSEQEVTDVLNYIRNSWANKHQPMKVSEIKELTK
jgi:mono/diheme cytochrome c family protein